MKFAVTAMLMAASTVWAQHDFLNGKTADEVIESHRSEIAFEAPTLNIGDDAPKMAVTEFVKGAPLNGFEEGQVYLVDFWATWCGPCIRSMPHLSELQETHSGDGLTVLAVDIWEQKEGDERSDHVKQFVEKHSENMRYTVAIDGDKYFEKEWMAAAGQRGIPTAMIVDREGKVGWIGYGTDPSMGEHLEAILANEHDMKTARKERLESMQAEFERQPESARMFRLAQQKMSKDAEAEGLAIIAALSQTEFADESNSLNAMAWPLVDAEQVSKERALLAKELATKACELTDWKDSNVLDTLAWAHHHLHEHDKAIEVEKKAIEHAADDDQRQAFTEVLAIFEKAADHH